MAEMLLNQLKSTRSTNGLEEAVKQCVLAASHENDPSIQKMLLKVHDTFFFERFLIFFRKINRQHSLVVHFYMLI